MQLLLLLASSSPPWISKAPQGGLFIDSGLEARLLLLDFSLVGASIFTSMSFASSVSKKYVKKAVDIEFVFFPTPGELIFLDGPLAGSSRCRSVSVSLLRLLT